MKNSKGLYISAIAGASYLVLDDISYWLDPEAGGFLLRNINIPSWVALLIISVVVTVGFMRKLQVSEDKKQFLINFDLTLSISLSAIIICLANIMLKSKEMIPLWMSRGVGCIFIILGSLFFVIFLKRNMMAVDESLKEKKRFVVFTSLVDLVSSLVVVGVIPILFGVILFL